MRLQAKATNRLQAAHAEGWAEVGQDMDVDINTGSQALLTAHDRLYVRAAPAAGGVKGAGRHSWHDCNNGFEQSASGACGGSACHWLV